MKLIILTTFFVFIFEVFSWDIDKTLNPCLKDNGPSFNYPGILTLTPGSNGGLTVFGRSKSKCPAIYCKCRIKASGSILPPKLTSFSCIDEKGCEYTSANMFGLPMRRIGNKEGCLAENIKEQNC
jgi:hypothetical protein